MPARRELTMRQIRQMLRLARDGVSAREIGRRLGIARSTVQDNLGRAAAAGLVWPLGDEITDVVLEHRLFSHAGVKQGIRRRAEPDWSSLVREMRRPGVNLVVLWEEYRDAHPEGYAYSRFCDLYREFERRLSPIMRQHHAAGDKVFVDYSGKRVPIVDPVTGVIREAEIFVAVLGASNLTYAEATWSQTLPDWIGAHVRLFGFLGGVPRLVVPDNLKSGINKPSFYDPEINRFYGMMANHYGVGVLPARPKKPRDKAKVENGVRFAQSYIPGPPAPADLLLAGRMQRRHRRDGGAHQRSPHATARHNTPGAVRGRRTRGPAALARGRLRLRRMAAGPRQSRLSRRGRRLSLLGAPPPDPRAGRHSAHGPHGRGVPSRPTRRRPRSPPWRPAARHRSRAHAERPPSLRRVDARPLRTLGSPDRPRDGGARHRHPARASSPRTGLSHLPGHPAAVPRPCPGQGRGGVGPGDRHWRAHLQEHRLHPRQQP